MQHPFTGQRPASATQKPVGAGQRAGGAAQWRTRAACPPGGPAAEVFLRKTLQRRRDAEPAPLVGGGHSQRGIEQAQPRAGLPRQVGGRLAPDPNKRASRRIGGPGQGGQEAEGATPRP